MEEKGIGEETTEITQKVDILENGLLDKEVGGAYVEPRLTELMVKKAEKCVQVRDRIQKWDRCRMLAEILVYGGYIGTAIYFYIQNHTQVKCGVNLSQWLAIQIVLTIL